MRRPVDARALPGAPATVQTDEDGVHRRLIELAIIQRHRTDAVRRNA
jgi:hypothetical protein